MEGHFASLESSRQDAGQPTQPESSPRRGRRGVLSLVVFLWVAANPLPAGAQAAFFRGLGDLSGGSSWSVATSVSPDGTTVVGYSRSPEGIEAFRFHFGSGLSGIGDLPGGTFESQALAASDGGLVVVGASRSGHGREAFIWDDAAGMRGLGDFPGGAFDSVASGVSDDGAVVVGWSQSDLGVEAFVWSAQDGMQRLGDLPGGSYFSQAYGVSSDGAVITGVSSSDRGDEPFIWDAENGIRPLASNPLVTGTSFDVSANGSVLVGIAGGFGPESQAFRWDELQGFRLLGRLGGTSGGSRAFAASGDGSVIVGWSDSEHGGTTFLWDQNSGLRDLRTLLFELGAYPVGWKLDAFANGISDDAFIVAGGGTNPSGAREAWVAGVSFDTDGDGVSSSQDVCRLDFDPLQLDGDGDGVGDACDAQVVFWQGQGLPKCFEVPVNEKFVVVSLDLGNGDLVDRSPFRCDCFGVEVPATTGAESVLVTHVGPDSVATQVCDSSPPFAFGVAPGQEMCRPEFDQNGSHTIVGTPFTEAGCGSGSGTALPSSIRSFVMVPEPRTPSIIALGSLLLAFLPRLRLDPNPSFRE